jgi:NAD(P)-dependent dehydrogenase (short-subunit alcohol dehydrogenase family)
MSISLDGKVIVVIGGTTGIGLSAAKAFIEAGAKVVAVGRNIENVTLAASALGKNAEVMTGDATNPRTAFFALDTANRVFGGIHGLYHVAGGSGRSAGDGPLHEATDEGWDYTIQLNLTSLFYSNRAAARYFLAHKIAGSVINMGSVLGFSPAAKFFATHAYSAAKAGIFGMTKSAAAYYAANSIRFNVIAPALVDTPMAHRAAHDPAIMNFVASKQPLDGGRIGQPQDLDGAAVFLMSDASKYVTGQILTVDGGWTVSDGQLPKS